MEDDKPEKPRWEGNDEPGKGQNPGKGEIPDPIGQIPIDPEASSPGGFQKGENEPWQQQKAEIKGKKEKGKGSEKGKDEEKREGNAKGLRPAAGSLRPAKLPSPIRRQEGNDDDDDDAADQQPGVLVQTSFLSSQGSSTDSHTKKKKGGSGQEIAVEVTEIEEGGEYYIEDRNWQELGCFITSHVVCWYFKKGIRLNKT